MSDLYQDRLTKELVLVNNDFVMVDDIRFIEQNLTQTLEFFLGEWFLDTTAGIPYYQSILIKDPDLLTLQALLMKAILSALGILELLSFEFNFDNRARTLSIIFNARSTHGPISYNNQLQVAV